MYFPHAWITPVRDGTRARSAGWQEADVEDQVGVVGQTVLEAETDAGDQEVFVEDFFWKRSVRSRAVSWT